jgi:hypothetical protein
MFKIPDRKIHCDLCDLCEPPPSVFSAPSAPVMWSVVNGSLPVSPVASCYSVVPGCRKTISSVRMAIIWIGRTDHTLRRLLPRRKTISTSDGPWQRRLVKLVGLRLLIVVSERLGIRSSRCSGAHRSFLQQAVTTCVFCSFFRRGFRKPLPRRRRLSLTEAGLRRWQSGRGGPLLPSPS